MALDLNDHLLESVDGLVAALLGHLVLEVVLGLVLGGNSGILGLVVNVAVSSSLELVSSSVGTSVGIDTGRSALLLVASGEVSSVGRVARARWVSSLASVTSSLLQVTSGYGLVVIVSLLHLRLDVTGGHVWNIVPGVVGSRLVNLLEILLIRVDLVGSLLSCVAKHIPEEELSIAHCKSISDGIRGVIQLINLQSFLN